MTRLAPIIKLEPHAEARIMSGYNYRIDPKRFSQSAHDGKQAQYVMARLPVYAFTRRYADRVANLWEHKGMVLGDELRRTGVRKGEVTYAGSIPAAPPKYRHHSNQMEIRGL